MPCYVCSRIHGCVWDDLLKLRANIVADKEQLGWFSHKITCTFTSQITGFKWIRHKKALVSSYFQRVYLIVQGLKHSLTALSSLVNLIRSELYITGLPLLFVKAMTEERLLRCKSRLIRVNCATIVHEVLVLLSLRLMKLLQLQVIRSYPFR